MAKLKRQRKYKLKLVDESRLIDLGSVTLTRFRAALFIILFCGIFVLIGIGIVWLTPIKKRLPGYMPPEQRAQTENAYLKVDSLEQLYRVHQAYLDNLIKLIDTDRLPDVADTVGDAIPLMPDSLMVSSEVEREFMKKMEEAGYIITVTNDYNDSDR